jgi:predicted HNH restriction endonuclease
MTAVWKNFRLSVIEERGAVCELCGTKYYGKQKRSLQLHHLNPAQYDNLDPKDFKLLCSSDHDLVERFAIKLKGSKSDAIKNREKWLELLREYLPYDVILAVGEPHES